VFSRTQADTSHTASRCNSFSDKVCKIARLSGVRIHDLRHSFASHLVSSGVSLPIVGKLLGHTQQQTTARYAHLADDPQREAANRFPVVL
jgi:integrase